MATRDSLTLTIKFPPMAFITVTALPTVKPISSRCFFVSGLPPMRRMTISSPGSVSVRGINALSSLSAVCLLVFSLLYTPCVAAIASIRRELGRKWALGVVLWQCAVAWVAALIVRLIGLLV